MRSNDLFYKSAYANAQQDDLWQALQEQADEESVNLPATVKEIMDTWTFKMGYPVINVTRDYTTGGVYITQVKLQIAYRMEFKNQNLSFIYCNRSGFYCGKLTTR